MKNIKIGNFEINNESPVFIIAEIGVNHNGSLNLAKEMIIEAKKAGADAVKFQSFCTELLVTKELRKADYQSSSTDEENSQYAMLKKLELSFEDQIELQRFCEIEDIIFLSTPFDLKSLDFLDSIGIQAFKISSSDTTNYQFLKQVARKHKPIILSTGMTNLGQIEKAVETISNENNEDLILLHCTASYPAPPEDCNIKAIPLIQQAFNVHVGYSDHTEGIGISPYTIPLDVKVVEKHFTLDKTMEGPDHKASLIPEELKGLVENVRYVEQALGDGKKVVQSSEVSNKQKLQKKIVARRDIEQGEILSESNTLAKRSEEGIEANHFDLITGNKINRAVKENDGIKLSYLED